MPNSEELAAHEQRMAERRRHGQEVLDRIAAEKGRPAQITDFGPGFCGGK